MDNAAREGSYRRVPQLRSTHRRILPPQGGRRHPTYASHYRFGEPDGAAPLVVYVGGAISIGVYLDRMASEPTAIAEVFGVAFGRSSLPAVDLLICPCPVETEGAELEWFADHLSDELIPALSVVAPTDVGLVGYSAGASHALAAAVLDERRVAAAFGPALRGLIARGGEEGPPLAAQLPPNVAPIELALFWNAEDDLLAPRHYAERLRPRFEPIVMAPRAGGHPFGSYARNGSAADAFGFVLERLRA